MWIKAPITSLVVVFMRPIMIIRWAYCIDSESQLICVVEYGFLILTWIRTVIFHSRRLVTKNMLSQFLCICIQEIWKCVALNIQRLSYGHLNSIIENLYSFSCLYTLANWWGESELAALNTWTENGSNAVLYSQFFKY